MEDSFNDPLNNCLLCDKNVFKHGGMYLVSLNNEVKPVCVECRENYAGNDLKYLHTEKYGDLEYSGKPKNFNEVTNVLLKRLTPEMYKQRTDNFAYGLEC